MINLRELQQVVQEAIDKGATSVEQVHRQIANMPLDFLAKIESLEGPVNQARDFNEKTIGSIYETIHSINTKAGEMAREILDKMENKTPQA
jgi:uncharacterized protein YaaR (DUF327 family)